MAFLTGYRLKRYGTWFKIIKKCCRTIRSPCLPSFRFLHLSGRGVPRDFKQTIYWYQKAYDLYKEQKDLKSIFDLLYGEDGLLLLYMAENDVPKATLLGKEFLKMLKDTPAGEESEEERMLWKARAMAELGDIHFDVNPSEDRLYEASKNNIAVLEMLIGYESADYQDEVDRLKGYASCNEGLVILQEGNILGKDYLERAESYYRQLVERNPLHQYRKEYSGVLVELAILLREEAIYKSRSDFSRSVEFMEPARKLFHKVLDIDRQLVEEAPTINNRESLAIALYHCGVVAVDNNESASYLREALAIVEKLIDETNDKTLNHYTRQSEV